MKSNKLRTIWNFQEGVPTGTTLELNDMALWTGELFKETPDVGADLVAIFVQEKHKRVLVVRVSVKLGNPNSKIKGSGNSPTTSAEKQVEKLSHRETEILKRVQHVVDEKLPTFKVHICRALATCRHVQPAAFKCFGDAHVAVWNRPIMQHRWISGIKERAKKNLRLQHYLKE